MRFSLLLLCVLQGLLLPGCRKKTSAEFYKLEAAQSSLVSREGDDAWISDEMTAILTGLQAVSAEAVEKPRAEALAAKISSERSRVAAEKVKPPPPAPVDPFAGRPSVVERPAQVEVPDAGEAEDAGEATAPEQPWTGMDEKLFVERFGSCFGKPVTVPLPDGKPATAYTLGPKAECQKRLGVENGTISYLFTARGLWGKSTETTKVMDAGSVLLPIPPQPPVPEPPPPVITTPGAPLPPGYEVVAPVTDAG